MKLSIKEQQEPYKKENSICKEKFENKYLKDKKYRRVRDIGHYTGEHRDVAHIICNLKHSVAKRVFIAFHNGSNYDYHFIIKQLAEKSEKQLVQKKTLKNTFPLQSQQ